MSRMKINSENLSNSGIKESFDHWHAPRGDGETLRLPTNSLKLLQLRQRVILTAVQKDLSTMPHNVFTREHKQARRGEAVTVQKAEIPQWLRRLGRASQGVQPSGTVHRWTTLTAAHNTGRTPRWVNWLWTSAQEGWTERNLSQSRCWQIKYFVPNRLREQTPWLGKFFTFHQSLIYLSRLLSGYVMFVDGKDRLYRTLGLVCNHYERG